MRQLVVIAHNMRSAHNVGSLLRTAEGLGVTQVFLTGYTPYPRRDRDERLPFIADKLDKQIDKTALGAARMIPWQYEEDILRVLADLTDEGYEIAGLEQAENSIPLHEYQAPEKIALLLGSEVTGIPPELMHRLSVLLEIPMHGQKESFNVIQAAAMALYRLRFH